MYIKYCDTNLKYKLKYLSKWRQIMVTLSVLNQSANFNVNHKSKVYSTEVQHTLIILWYLTEINSFSITDIKNLRPSENL